MDEDWEAGLWTAATRDGYLASGERAIAALRDHLAVVAACRSDADKPRIEESAERVRTAYVALGNAEFDYSATLAPFAELEVPDEDEELEVVHVDPEAAHGLVSFMMRADYVVTSQAEVLRAGRQAYADLWPEDSASEAEDDVQLLGRALYLVMHAGGTSALERTPGLRPTVRLTRSVAQEHLLSVADLDRIFDDADALFAVDGQVLHTHVDAW